MTLPAGADLMVSAAASLSEAIREAADAYQKSGGGRITVGLGGSQLLARQIEAGAPADVFISADQATMDRLIGKRLIVKNSMTPLLTNRLVVIVPADSKLEINSAQDLARPDPRRIALGDPDLVPAGIYAKAWLTQGESWNAVRGKLVGMENVRGVLAAVEAGNADAGIVYQTDAMISAKVRVALTVPIAQHPPIRYPAAVCQNAASPGQAARFLKWLQGPESGAVFEKHGFIRINSGPSR